MSDIDTLVARFEAAGLKHASRSRVVWWLEEEGTTAPVRAAFIDRVLDWGLWEPPEQLESRLQRETKRVSAGYRDAARTIRAVTLHPTRRSLLFALGLIAILPVWIGFLFLPGEGIQQWARLVQALIFGVPPFVAGALRLARFFRPDRVELHHDRVRSMRGTTEITSVSPREIAFVDVARIMDGKVRSLVDDMPRGKLNWLTGNYKSGSWTVYAELRDGRVVVLADHIDETTAKATVLHLERELELREPLRVRVEEDSAATEDDEAVAASMEHGPDRDTERTATR